MPKKAAFLCAGVFGLLAWAYPIVSRGDDAPPPVPWTQEKVKPPEVEDKDKNDTPVATCEKTDKKTGEKYTDVGYKDGTKITYYPDSKKWVVETPGPNGPSKKMYDAKNKTISVKEPGQKKWQEVDPAKDPAAKKWKEDLEKAEQDAKKKSDSTPLRDRPVRQSYLYPPWFSGLFVNVGYNVPLPMPPKARSERPIQLAATQDRPQEKTPQSQGNVPPGTPVVVINTKLVTYGGPGPGTTIHFFEPENPGKPKPEEYVTNDKPQNSWKPEDVPGPQTQPGPTPGGTAPVPVPGTGGGYVYFAGSWASVRIPVSFLQSCTADDDWDEDDIPKKDEGPKPTQKTQADEPRRETIEQRQAREWDEGIRNDIAAPKPPPPVEYNPVGETAWIKGVREDAARFNAQIAKNLENRRNSCAPDWVWDWAHGNPIWVDQQYLMKRQWMIEIYEAAYIHAREQGLSNLGAHAYAQIKVDDWRQESLDQFVNMMIEHLQNFQGAINGIQAMKAAAEYAEEFLKAKDIMRKKEIMEKAIKQAKAAQGAPKSAPKNPKLAQGGVYEALPPENAPKVKNPKLNEGGVHEALPAEETGTGTQKYGPEDGPRQTANKPQAVCPRPSNVQKEQELKQLEAKIETKAKRTDELAAKLSENRIGEKDPDYFKENPGAKLTQPQREAMEKEFDKLMGENIKDLSKAIQIRNEIYPKAPGGKSSITPQEAKALLSQRKPLMGADMTPESEAPTGFYGPGGTQKLPVTGPGQTQPLRGPGDTQKLGAPYSQ